MTQPAKRDMNKNAEKKPEETCDFPESSDMCDFGYVLQIVDSKLPAGETE